jgi:hypothetical protein
MNNETIIAWDERELIDNVYHRLRQKSTAARGTVQILADGMYGFTSQEQQDIIEWLRRDVDAISEVNRWLDVWITSQRTSTEE